MRITRRSALIQCVDLLWNAEHNCYDIMIPVAHSAHCGTCNCTSYNTYSGWSVKEHNTIDFLKVNLKLLFKG